MENSVNKLQNKNKKKTTKIKWSKKNLILGTKKSKFVAYYDDEEEEISL